MVICRYCHFCPGLEVCSEVEVKLLELFALKCIAAPVYEHSGAMHCCENLRF